MRADSFPYARSVYADAPARSSCRQRPSTDGPAARGPSPWRRRDSGGPPRRGGVGGRAGARPGGEADRASLRGVRQVDDLEVVEHGDGGTAAHLIDHLLHEWLQHHFSVDGAEVPRGEGEDLGPQEETPSIAPDVTETFERVKRPSDRGGGEAGEDGHLAQRHLRVFPRERLQHAQPALERRDEFLRTVFRHAKNGLSVVHERLTTRSCDD